MELAGRYLKIFQAAQQLGDAAILSSLRHQQVLRKPSGFLTYSNMPELAKQARDTLAIQGIPVTPKTLREQAEAIIAETKTLLEDEIGITYDEMGRYYEQL